MPRALAIGLGCALTLVAGSAQAQPTPDETPSPREGATPDRSAPSGPSPEDLRRAAESFDAGAAALRAGQYELAASHFEAAYAAAPAPQALRNAMRSRELAGQPARAATLAALALSGDADARTRELAEEVLRTLQPALYRLSVTCSTPCVLAVDTRLVPGAASTARDLFIEPGSARVAASFEASRHTERTVEARAGERGRLTLDAPPVTTTPPPRPVLSPSPVPPSPVPRSPVPRPLPAVPPGDEGAFGAHPALFFTALGATAVLGGVTIWSGVDTLGSPGVEAVREDCVGLGPSCPTYQEGLDKQLRTNALIGATAGAAAVSLVIGAFLTDWSGGSDGAEAGLDVGPTHAAFLLRAPLR